MPVLETVAVSASGVRAVREAVAKLPRKRSFPSNPSASERKLESLDSEVLYQEVESILNQVVRTQMTLPAWHKKLDDIVLHPVWGNDYAAGYPVYGVPSGIHLGSTDYGRH